MPRARLAPLLALALASALALLAACGREPEGPKPSQALARIASGPHEVAVLALPGLGEIEIELLPELAPATVAHWKALAARGFFDGTSFHRVVPGFVVQGGDPNTKNRDPRDDGLGGSAEVPPDEFSDYPVVRGTVAMAHKGREGTAGSQFFIVHGDARHLDGHYTIFGRVVRDMETVDAITKLELDRVGRWGPRDRPYPVAAVVERTTLRPAAAAAADAAPLASAGASGYPATPVAR